MLADTAGYLPDAVHLAVVDPGVGTERRGVAAVTPRGLLVGPDNGLLMSATDTLGGVLAAYEPAAPEYRLPDPLVAVLPGKLVTDVLTVGHFGNLCLAAAPDDLRLSGLGPLVAVYSSRVAVTGQALLYTDSAGRLAVAINRGSAAEVLGSAQELTITASPTET